MKLLRDTWLLFKRNIKATVRNPVWLLIGLFQPICYMLLFAPLLNNLSSAPGFPPGGALKLFTPGLLILMGMYGAAFVGFDLLAELRAGVIEQMRVTPVSRLALLLGRALRDVVTLLVQSVLLLLVAVLLGLRADPAGVAMVIGLLILIGLLASSCSYALALLLKNENALSSMLNTVLMPLMLLSGIYLPLSLAPLAVRPIAIFNPFAHAVDAARALFNGNFGDITVFKGFIIMGILALLALFWAARSFRQATA